MRDFVITGSLIALLSSGCGSDRDLVIGRNGIAAVTSRMDGGDLDANLAEDATEELSVTDDASPTDDVIEATPCPVGETPPAGSLLHRYSFDGTGTLVEDSVGTEDGTVMGGAMLDGSGSLRLGGGNDFVNLPNRLISPLTEMTMVAWISIPPNTGTPFNRIFDFGTSVSGEDRRDNNPGKSFVMMTPYSNTGDGKDLTMQMAIPGSGVIQIASDRPMRDGTIHQVALTFRSGSRAWLYLDGELLGTRATTMKLADIDDVNNWLGQSQFSQDNNLVSTFTEFRIYNQVLSACALSASLRAGPDALP